MALHLLHGTLHCTIFSAENLVNEFRFTGAAPGILRQVVGMVENTVHLGRGPSRLYATVDLGEKRARVGRTRVIEGEPVNPVWMESFQIYCAHWVANVLVSIKDDDTVGSHVVGRARVKVSELLRGAAVESWYDLYKDDGSKVKGGGRVRVRMLFEGVKANEEMGAVVQRAYFGQRRGCALRLYQDAHMQEGFMPKIFLSDGRLKEPTRCWDDIYTAIAAAEVFIYVAGWSVYTEISLRRDASAAAGRAETLGELLRRKAEAGVKVLVLVWDDRTSLALVRPTGIMDTHDEETFSYFRGTKVKCILCPRLPDSSLSVAQGVRLSTLFTHHQKLVSCDAAAAADQIPANSSLSANSAHFSSSPSNSAHFSANSARFSLPSANSAHFSTPPASSYPPSANSADFSANSARLSSPSANSAHFSAPPTSSYPPSNSADFSANSARFSSPSANSAHFSAPPASSYPPSANSADFYAPPAFPYPPSANSAHFSPPSAYPYPPPPSSFYPASPFAPPPYADSPSHHYFDPSYSTSSHDGSSHHHFFPSYAAASSHFSGPPRQIVSFIGGIDLCKGRYDDQRHSLFRTLPFEHATDFHQPCLKNASLACGGPREPWHDIHCRLLGPAAWDVVKNFEQRWQKQGVDHALLDLSSHPRLLPSSTTALPDESPDSWNAQLFRSIDGGAAFGFPDNPADAAQRGLVSGKDNVIERSIQDAYIHAIRRAKRFIYIENQYFLGSCHAWDTMQDAGCYHLIPIEIVLKIVSKIEAGERFVAYIVLPMWPEGVPESNAVQAILEWQRRTMEMMYKQIALTLHAAGRTEEKPTDYLTFFCLGNREANCFDEQQPQQIPETSPNYKSAQEYRRFMIYVHSKLMIVDDEYIILGSANINQRSMDGGRDTEIAIGAYQPFHSSDTDPVRGQVHGFRMSLWYEHLGHLNDLFLEPWSLGCVRHVNDAATELWDLFSGEENVDLPGHLLMYPLTVSHDGSVSEFPGQPFFPDTKASIAGKLTSLPAVLTT